MDYVVLTLRFLIGAFLGTLLGLWLTFLQVPVILGIILSVLMGILCVIYGDRFIESFARIFRYF